MLHPSGSPDYIYKVRIQISEGDFMPKILFSYRAADAAIAERILGRLVHTYGHDDVHADVLYYEVS